MVMPIVRASNYTRLERDGGIEDQDPAFIQDVGTWLMLDRWSEDQIMESGADGKVVEMKWPT